MIEKFGVGNRVKKILITGLPIIGGQLSLVLMGMADTVMVGKLGHTSIAATGLSVSIFFLVSIFGIGLISATTPMITAYRVKNEESILPAFFRDLLITGQLTSILIFICLMIIIIILPQLGQEKEVVKLARPFLLLLAVSVFPMNWYLSGKSVCDGFFITKIPMIITTFALLLNIFFNWIFIYGNLGFTAMGLTGAGLATLLARIFMAVCISIYIFRTEKIGFRIKDTFSGLLSKTNYYKPILKLGVPAGFQFFFEIVAFSGAAIIAGKLGSVQQASHQIAINIASFTFMFAVGISVSGSMYVAEYYAKNDITAARKYGISSLKLIIMVEVIFALIFIFFNKPLTGIYTKELPVLNTASKLLLIAAVFQIVDGMQAISLGLLRGLHDTKIPSYLTFVAYWLIGIPLALFLGLNTKLGIYGIWWALTFSLFFISISATWRFLNKTSSA
ncbi:MAG: MATE family efflux transporter [Bacteroidetes bacterium]|nr:MATE family efflux transporter [Bacteroidota bacterium]